MNQYRDILVPAPMYKIGRYDPIPDPTARSQYIFMRVRCEDGKLIKYIDLYGNILVNEKEE